MNRPRMLKTLSILEKMHPDNTNVFASNIIDGYENWSWWCDLHSGDVPMEPDKIRSCTVLVSNIYDVKFIQMWRRR